MNVAKFWSWRIRVSIPVFPACKAGALPDGGGDNTLKKEYDNFKTVQQGNQMLGHSFHVLAN